MAFIILVRHGESEGNAAEVLTGQADVDLTANGRAQARQTAQSLDVPIHSAFSSELKRAKQTLSEIQTELDLPDLPVTTHIALNERDFGEFNNNSKAKLQQKLSEAAYLDLVRGWDVQAPGGESLKMVYERVVQFFLEVILPEAISGNNVLVVSHHQTLRALIKYLDDISDDVISELRLKNAQAIVYEVSETGQVTKLT